MSNLSSSPIARPFGEWVSPITSDMLTQSSVSFHDVYIRGSMVYWLESRPWEKGRGVLMCCSLEFFNNSQDSSQGKHIEITPADFSVGTGVHEYGGGACFVTSDCMVFFSNKHDRRIYLQTQESGTVTISEEIISVSYLPPVPITVENDAWRYADFTYDSLNHILYCVREDHSKENCEATTAIVSIRVGDSPSEPTVLVSGADFYCSPRIEPFSNKLCWVQWNHPNMPFFSTEAYFGKVLLNESSVEMTEIRQVAGGPEEAVMEPSWLTPFTIVYVSDRNGFWNLYICDVRDMKQEHVCLCDKKAEFAEPQWTFRRTMYGVFDGTIVAACIDNGLYRLLSIDIEQNRVEEISCPYEYISHVDVSDSQFAFIGGSASCAPTIITRQIHPPFSEYVEVKRSSSLQVAQDFFSCPIPIQFPSVEGEAYALYYAPRNPNFVGLPSEKPPLLVRTHGGPTSAAVPYLNLMIQFFTSRGFAFADLNYGGSTGYCREFRMRLHKKWGIVDIDDACSLASFLVDRGDVDGNRLCIDGRSAGGYTTLAALTFRDTFKAGCSLFGVSNLELLAAETHKFESRYLDCLLGPYPEMTHIYKERSPLFHTDQIRAPICLFQGLDDKIVPPNQSRLVYEAVKEKGVPTCLVEYPGEGHGFVQADNIKTTLEGELYFFGKVFGFHPPELSVSLPIENLPETN